MCGIAVLYGDTAVESLNAALSKISHRGPDDQHTFVSENKQLAIGFVRLSINDSSINGRQPHQNDEIVSAVNGEIYNTTELIQKYKLSLLGQCDTHIIAPLFNQIGKDVITELDGFYAGVLYKKTTKELHLIRDHIGKKPLLYGKADGNIFVVSELKSVTNIDWFKQVPLGCSKLNLTCGTLTQLATHIPTNKATGNLTSNLEQAVLKRMPHNAFGLFLSGGLDSSIITAIACRNRRDITYFSLGSAGSADIEKVQVLAQHLDLNNIKIIEPPSEELLGNIIENVVWATESYNPSIISNGLATYILAQAARKEGLKVVLTGEGADELFGGYHEQPPDLEWRKIRKNLLQDMRYTELRRLDNCTMAHSIEARCPFLDRTIKHIADNLKYPQYYNQGKNKVILRETFGHLLPKEISERKKCSFDVGSGIRKQIVEYLTRNGNTEAAELKQIWMNLFNYDTANPYFYSYPTFDAAIAKRGVSHR